MIATRWTLLITVGAVAGGISLWLRRGPQAPNRPTAAPAITVTFPEKSATAPSAPVALTPKPIAAPKPIPVPQLSPTELALATQELKEFKSLQSKVLKTADERQDYHRRLRDPALLRRHRNVLADKSVPTNLHEQALELVIESMKLGDPLAQQILSEVVADPFIETAPASPLRQNQAELKAEALLAWSSQPETPAHQIEAHLPGPISRRIWTQVLAHQSNNVTESDLERVGSH